ncbi:MAG: hypothetical protein HYT13_00505 [Candidatus Liptonbacteria bacterium]|nr:hypothetical protein [Candidatus Liptonbacteria bacterium]
MKRAVLIILGLIIVQFLIDVFFAKVFPEIPVSPLRATLIGASALALFFIIRRFTNKFVSPLLGALSIFSSALFGALLVQSDYLVSKSAASGIVHIIILIIAYLMLSRLAIFEKR